MVTSWFEAGPANPCVPVWFIHVVPIAHRLDGLLHAG